MRIAYKTGKQGFTLVELMVSMLVLSIVMLGVFGLFASQQQNFRSTSDLARGQFNLRIAMLTISRDIRNAAYTGSPGLPLGFDTANSIKNPLFDPTNPLLPISPVNKGAAGDISFLKVKTKAWGTSTNELLDSSTTVDAIDIWANFTLRTAEPLNDIPTGTVTFQLTNSDIFLSPKGDPVAIILIGDEDHVESHTVSAVQLSQGTTVGSITLIEPTENTFYKGSLAGLPSPTQIVPIIHRRYFLDERASVTGRSQVRTLVRRDYYAHSFEDTEVAQYIDDLQIAYALADYEVIHTPGQPDKLEPTRKIYSNIDPELVPDADHDPIANPWAIRAVSLNMTSISFPRTGEAGTRGKPHPVFTEMSRMIRTRNVGLQKLK